MAQIEVGWKPQICLKSEAKVGQKDRFSRQKVPKVGGEDARKKRYVDT